MNNSMLSKRFLSFAMLIVILAIPTLLCGFIAGFKTAFQIWAFFLAIMIPSIGGTVVVQKYFWKYERLSFLLSAGVGGTAFFITSVVGMSMDARASSWGQIFSLSAIIGLISFVAIIIITPLYSFIARTIFKAR